MKKIIILILVFALLIPSIAFGNINDYNRVIEKGILGQGGLNLDKGITRAELATVSVRLLGLENTKDSFKSSGTFKDVSGWAVPYVNLASAKGIMSGVSSDKFNPNGKVTYIEVLTVLMRILGYEDNIDFRNFPSGYYSKATEIGLADIYIPHNEVVTREIVAKTIDKAFDLKIKDKEYTFIQSFSNSTYVPPVVNKPVDKISIKDLIFNTTIIGGFSGELLGGTDFTGYKVDLLSGKGKLYKSTTLDKSGKFSISGFNIDMLTQLSGYTYKIYDNQGSLILEDNLK